LHLA